MYDDDVDNNYNNKKTIYWPLSEVVEWICRFV